MKWKVLKELKCECYIAIIVYLYSYVHLIKNKGVLKMWRKWILLLFIIIIITSNDDLQPSTIITNLLPSRLVLSY